MKPVKYQDVARGAVMDMVDTLREHCAWLLESLLSCCGAGHEEERGEDNERARLLRDSDR